MRAIRGVLLAAVLVMGVAAQQPQPGQRQPLSASGLILGQVIDAGTGRPVAGALVRLSGGSDRPIAQAGPFESSAAPPESRLVITNRDGRFLFRDLPPGSYSADATTSGYTTGAFGRRRLNGPTRPIALGEGERVLDATIRVWKFAAITGTVTDEAGEPMIGAAVVALRRAIFGGRRTLVVETKAQADDRGFYRIGGLTPGDYVVAAPIIVTSVPLSAVDEEKDLIRTGGDVARAMSIRRMESGAPGNIGNGVNIGDQQVQVDPLMGRLSGSAVNMPPMADGRFVTYQTTFHGGGTSASQATAITLVSGETRSGVDLRLKPVATARVSGTIAGPEGPAASLGVRLVPAEDEEGTLNAGLETALAMTDGVGRFTFPGVPAGSYVLKAYRVSRPRPPSASSVSLVGGVPTNAGDGAPTDPVGPNLWARVPVTVGGDDVTDVRVTLRAGARISGRVEFEGSAPVPAPSRLQLLTVIVVPLDNRAASSAPALTPRLDADGRFTTSGYPPGRYLINVADPGPEWAIKSIQGSGLNLLDRPLELDADDITGVVVTFTDRIAELSGTVSGAGSANDDVTVVVFPGDYQAWIANGRSPRRWSMAIAGRNGSYHLRLPPPGDYFVVAVLNDRLADADLAYFTALSRVATRITVAEGEKKTLALPTTQIR
jgi:protocatechuate 3,4-dioxygenase beta subunit